MEGIGGDSMEQWIIYLKCTDGAGYFTQIIMTSTNREVGVHPYKSRARRFSSRQDAFNTAKGLKTMFKCVISYEVIKL